MIDNYMKSITKVTGLESLMVGILIFRFKTGLSIGPKINKITKKNEKEYIFYGKQSDHLPVFELDLVLALRRIL